MEAVRLKSSSVGLSDRARRHEVRWYTWYSGYRAKPKKAWFDFWLTLFIAFCQLVLISPSLCATNTQTLPYTSEAACFPADS
jgi:hypothetical protein